MKCRSGEVTIVADDVPAIFFASLQVKPGACRLVKRGQPSVLFTADWGLRAGPAMRLTRCGISWKTL
jgi:hypothetical protein